MIENNEVRAVFGPETITVYQAYRAEIAVPASLNGRFMAGFKRERMTWIKPSFLWMMYRSGWASKPGQEHVLAIEITREGFEWALNRSALSHYDRRQHVDRETWRAMLIEPVRIQWDPERDIQMEKQPFRSLQVGLSGEAVERYCDEWIVGITDQTELAHSIRTLVDKRDFGAATELLPREEVYTLPDSTAARIGTQGSRRIGY